MSIWKKALTYKQYREVMSVISENANTAIKRIASENQIEQSVFDLINEGRQLLTNGYSTHGKDHATTKEIINSCDRLAYKMFMYNETLHLSDKEAVIHEVQVVRNLCSTMYKMSKRMEVFEDANNNNSVVNH